MEGYSPLTICVTLFFSLCGDFILMLLWNCVFQSVSKMKYKNAKTQWCFKKHSICWNVKWFFSWITNATCLTKSVQQPFKYWVLYIKIGSVQAYIPHLILFIKRNLCLPCMQDDEQFRIIITLLRSYFLFPIKPKYMKDWRSIAMP